MSAIIIILRILIVYRALAIHNKSVQHLINYEELSESKAKDKAISILKNTKKLADEYLLIMEFDTKPKLFNWIIKLRSYNLKIRSNYSTKGTIE